VEECKPLGSGSVTDEDFNTMKAFLRQAGHIFLAR